MRLLSRAIFRRRPAVVRYALALGFIAAALGAKLLLATLLTRDMPALLFFLAITGTALVGGLGPGLLAAVLGTLCDEYFFMAPFGSWRLNDSDQILRLLLFFTEAAVLCTLCAGLRNLHFAERNARRRARRGESAARALQHRMLRVIDNERMRLGHDLHDGLGQQLTAITLLTRSLEERLRLVAPHEAEEASVLTGLAKLAIEWTHDLCRTLAPTDDALDDLPEMLRELATKTAVLFRIGCRFESALSHREIRPVVATHLYRIAQEAITNAIRHGKAQQVLIRLQDNPSGFLLQISDDGGGLDAAKPSAEGMGLRIMRYRAEMIGAELSVRPGDAGGTIVTVSRGGPNTLPEHVDVTH